MGQWINNIRNLAIVYALVLLLATCVVGGFLYIAYQSSAYNESKAAIEADIRGFKDLYNFSGNSSALVKALEQRLQSSEISSFYMLYDSNEEKLAGNLKTLPTVIEYQDEDFIVYEVSYGNVVGNAPQERDPFYQHYDIMTKTITFGDFESERSVKLMIGRDVDAFQTSQTVITSLAWITVLIIITMALIGFLIASMILNRVRLIHHTATQVIETGDFSSRIPESAARGDFKPLAKTLNEMLERIEEAIAAIRQVSDNIAHDLRTPLTRLQHHIDALKAGKEGVSIEDVSSETNRIIKTFNALLRISNIEHGKRSAGFGNVNLKLLLNDLNEYYGLLTAEKSQRFDVTIPSVIPHIHGDKDLLFQAFSNMVENAMKYTPEGGNISLKASMKDNHVLISITDDGPGIVDENKPKIFQRFFRAEQSRHTPGLGLGLSLVKAVMDLHKADIYLENNTPSGLIITTSFKSSA